MLNTIWAVMILIAVLYGAFTGKMSDVTNAALDSAGEAISLCITMAGVVALWMGLMEIATRAGLVAKLTRGIAPFLRFMFPRLPKDHPAGQYIATNIIANVLGLGWACTPAGLKAMEALAQLEVERGNPEYLQEDAIAGSEKYVKSGSGKPVKSDNCSVKLGSDSDKPTDSVGHFSGSGKNRRASNEMCTFLILNISSLQLIPVNMIAYRNQYGSSNPTAIIVPAIVATLISTLIAILYCKIKDSGYNELR